MNKEHMDSNQLQKLKNLIKVNLQEMVSDFNLFVEKTSELKMDYFTISLKFLEENRLEFPGTFTIHTGFFREFMVEYFYDEKYEEFFREMKNNNLFVLDKSMLNPQFTNFGSMLIGYLQKLAETQHFDPVKFKEQFPLPFDENLFKRCWNALLPWISNIPIRVKIYYLIFGIKLEGNNYLLDSDRKLMLRIPSKD